MITEPEGGVSSPAAGATDGSEPPGMGAGNQVSASQRASCAKA